ncbi:hypothetical protein F5050DRAFT_1714224 [Lentinula boryana]|uniref:Uncharacterized protein n=1 Tax=Lentinula boryana TaxID=40481 RepID=A0ABQ8Q5I9_9AGAR|nr:hypothetical protein F5050DRAFT_1714224 [Lentinula boryana]
MYPCIISSSFEADHPKLSSELEPSPRNSNDSQPTHLPTASPMSNERNATIDAQYDAVTRYICNVGFRGIENISMDPVDASSVSLNTTLDLCTLALELAESALDESQEEVLIHSIRMDQKQNNRYWRQPQAESEDTILSCWRSDPSFSFHGYGLQQDLVPANRSDEVIGSLGIPGREHDPIVPKLPSMDMQDLYSRVNVLFEKLENKKLKKMVLVPEDEYIIPDLSSSLVLSLSGQFESKVACERRPRCDGMR